jgi:probable F420-dependent oxidoreductase
VTIAVGVNLSPVPLSELGEAARRAEALGYESAWIGEHVIVPQELTSHYPYGDHPPLRADFRFFDPLCALALIAAQTTRLRLGTGVLILPLRDPFTTARAIVTVDGLSGGRLLLGMGAGWMREEFDLLGVPFASRGARFDEMLELLTRLFVDAAPEHHGAIWNLPASGFEPKPVQRPRPPFLLGGSSPVALRRAACSGDGWYGSRTTPEDLGAIVARLAAHRSGRPPLSITVGGVPGAALEAYEMAGAERVVVTPWERSHQWRAGLEEAAAALHLHGRAPHGTITRSAL